jgi:hypothetical protein
MLKLIDETQMPIAPKHAFKEKSAKLLILLPLKTIYFQTFQFETPCINSEHRISHRIAYPPLLESFGESPKAMINSSRPPANFK